MAMTKKEKADFEKILFRANTLAALRWTDEIMPDISRSDATGTVTCGWDYFTESLFTVDRVEQRRSDTYRSTGGINLFSSELLALKALRHAVEKECAARLYRVDRLIENALGDGA